MTDHEPVPAREDPHTRADIEFHAATAHVYEETLDPLFRAHDALITEPLYESLERMAPGRDALDIGCGTGMNVVRLARRGFRVRGIDHSEAMLAIADEKVRDRGLTDRVELHTGDVRSLPFADASFDLVTCTGVLHHLRPSMRECVAEAERVLRPGGVLCIAEPVDASNPSLRAWERLRRLWERVSSRLARRQRADAPAGAAQESGPAEPLDVPDHDEGPLDMAALTTALDAVGLESDITYWSFFDGLHRLRPLWLQKGIVYGGSRPWRRRGGNMIVVLARTR